MKIRLLIALMLFSIASFAKNDSTQKFGYTFQQTLVGQYAITNPTQIGQNSNNQSGNTFHDSAMRTSLSSTFFMGVRTWKGGNIYLNPEVAGGSGLSGTVGVAGYVNGEVFRVGNPSPTLFLARFFFRQEIGLGGNKSYVAPGQNQLGEFTSDKRLVFTVGKFTLADIFDDNHYSHDPRTRLLNWSLMASGAWDFASNTKGYTYAAVAEYISPQISFRVGSGVEPMFANGPLAPHKFMDMEVQAGNGYEINYEVEKPFHFFNTKQSIIRVLIFTNETHGGKYADVIHTKTSDSIFINNVSQSMNNARSQGYNLKYGFSLNLEQPLGKHGGMFTRYSWNDGSNESWAFAEIDRSLAAGIVVHGGLWHRYDDRFTSGIAINGISKAHQGYLAAGGYGFMAGDGGLNYGYEEVLEAQYEFEIGRGFIVSPDYQFILNPAYNRNNGPVNVFGVRTHIQF